MTTETTVTLGEALPAEMARVRDEVMQMYLEIGAPCRLAAGMMRASLDDAARAMVEGDVVKMIAAYKDLAGHQ